MGVMELIKQEMGNFVKPYKAKCENMLKFVKQNIVHKTQGHLIYPFKIELYTFVVVL